MENNIKKPSPKMLVLICTPKLADRAAEMLSRYSIPVQYRLNASGTASSEVMDMLGLGSIDKCLIAAMIDSDKGKMILGKLHSELRLDTVNSGIAFTMPLGGVSGIVIHMLREAEEKNTVDFGRKDMYVMTEATHSLITAVVNRGFSGDVMEAARAAGAFGGTVVHSRSILADDSIGLKALGAGEERDIVLIIADSESRLAIMRAVSEKCGAASEAKGIVLSLPIDSVMGI
ncbi:MAG: hypothetical protein U0M06_12150 [Clostridia bacterium]|nr:hypothetical protein [Clostridia bacterium]